MKVNLQEMVKRITIIQKKSMTNKNRSQWWKKPSQKGQFFSKILTIKILEMIIITIKS